MQRRAETPKPEAPAGAPAAGAALTSPTKP